MYWETTRTGWQKKAYALEYATDSAIAEKALEYSMEHGYICYVADNIELKLE